MKKTALNLLSRIVTYYKSKNSRNMPITLGREVQVKNARMLNSRLDLLEMLPKNGIVAEIGVDRGNFSQAILDKCEPKHLLLVDSWGSERFGWKKMIKVIESFIAYPNVRVLRSDSVNAAKEQPEKHFDWIYLDTDHSYETTKSELHAWAPKIKDGGFICGHDFAMGNWNSNIRYGVREAVYEFCADEKWEMIFITAELNAPSFGIRRI